MFDCQEDTCNNLNKLSFQMKYNICTFFTLWGFLMRLHFLISISVVFTHPGWKKQKQNMDEYNQPWRCYSLNLRYFVPQFIAKLQELWTDETDNVWMTAHHRSVDIPEGSLLAVQDLPLDFILSPVVPVDEIKHCEKGSCFACCISPMSKSLISIEA